MSLSSLIVCRAVIVWGSKKLSWLREKSSRKWTRTTWSWSSDWFSSIAVRSRWSLSSSCCEIEKGEQCDQVITRSARTVPVKEQREEIIHLRRTLHTPLKFKLLEKLVIGEHIKRRWIAVMSTTIGEETFSSASSTMPANLVKRMSSRLTGSGPSSRSSWGGFGIFGRKWKIFEWRDGEPSGA